MLQQKSLLALPALLVVAHILVLLPLPFPLQAMGALLLTGLIPGLLWVDLLVGRSSQPPTRFEAWLYAIGIGYSNIVILMLLVQAWPGPVVWWQTLLAFDSVTGLLWFWLFWRSGKAPWGGESGTTAADLLLAPTARANQGQGQRGWLIAGGVALLLIGGFFRVSNLGYAEFQGDEARAALRAAAIIQGFDDVLFIHKKGPTEILLPTVIYSLSSHLNETTARLPFALANLAALFAIWLLGWRLFGPLAGWAAAFLLAFDGYIIGFSHIVQYQSIVILVSALVVVIAYRLLRQPEAVARYLLLAAILLATGLLSHYEAAQAVVPVGFLLLALLWQQPRQWLRFAMAALPAVIVGGSLLAIFYVPFVLHPNFQATYTYLVDRRVGGAFPYNNLADFFLRSTVYNSTYYVLLMIGLAVVALLWAYQRYLPRLWAYGCGGLVLIILGLTFWQADGLVLGDTDLMVVPFVLALLLVWLLPRLPVEERLLWFWFGAPLLVAFFFTEKPRTHIYIFFTAWALLAGMVVAHGWQLLRRRTGATVAGGAGLAAALVATVVFGNYAYWYFVHSGVEVLQNWQTQRPAGYWVPYDEPDNKAIFGFPLANGWKVVGTLYAKGQIEGDYETNEKEAWVPAWYTRGERRCQRTAQWFFQIDNLEPFDEGDRLYMEHILRQGFEKWGKVTINGADRMIIYKRTGVHHDFPTQLPTENLPVYPLIDYEPRFDQLAQADFPLTYPEVNQPIGHSLHSNLGNQIWLEGYDIDYPKPLKPNDVIHLTLYWRAQQVITQSYKVFNQSFYGNGTMIAQQDGYPVCETRETWRWDPGELITDKYEIPVKADAPDGLYPFYTGMYLAETLERLPVLDEAGTVIGNQIHLTDIRVGEE